MTIVRIIALLAMLAYGHKALVVYTPTWAHLIPFMVTIVVYWATVLLPDDTITRLWED